MRSLTLLSAYTRRSFLTWMGFRSFLYTLVINQAIAPLLGFAVWSAALPDQADISTYFVALLAVQMMTVSYEYHTVSMAIYEGALNDDLLRPHPTVLPPLGENFAMRIWHMVTGLPIFVLAMVLTGVSFGLVDTLVAIPAVVMAAALRFLFVYMLSLSALWTQQAGGVTGLGSTLVFLLGGMAAPITLFPDSIRPLAEALPFRAMLGFPAEIASGNLDTMQIIQGYGWQLVWLAVFIPMNVGVWRTGVRRYTALGG